jgi:hypothetical protein
VSLPWIPGAVRELLMADTTFATLVGNPDRVTFKNPPSVTTPWVEIRTAGNISISGDGVAWSPLIQVAACGPPGNPDLQENLWAIAARAAHVLGRARNVAYQDMTYSGRHTDGPLEDVDTSRGDSTPIFRAIVRAELTAKTT